MLESLETRCLFNTAAAIDSAAPASLSTAGLLTIIGTGAADHIGVWQPDAKTLRVEMNGQSQDFADADVKNLYVDGGMGNDLVVIGAHDHNATLIGGRGNDSLSAGDGNDDLYGGAGDDYLFGRGGNDVIHEGRHADGADLILGGDGNDTVDYSRRTRNIRVGIGILADDGEKGEHDNVQADIETVIGGNGNDRLSTTRPDNSVVLYGAGGNDTLIGSNGRDYLDGGKGHDRIWNVTGDDVVNAKDNQADIICGGGTFEYVATDKMDFVMHDEV